jgi:hypothetical protein
MIGSLFLICGGFNAELMKAELASKKLKKIRNCRPDIIFNQGGGRSKRIQPGKGVPTIYKK